MTPWERRVHRAIVTVLVAATALPLVFQVIRILDVPGESYIDVVYLFAGKSSLYAMLVLPFFATPPLLALGTAHTALVRRRMRRRDGDPARRPTWTAFAVCGLTWAFVWVSFHLVPLFAREAHLERGTLDAWLDLLL